MENILMKYFEERFHKPAVDSKVDIRQNPVITLSREYGCPARDVSNILLESLKAVQGRKEQPWRLISKEILQEAAQELNMHPSKVQSVLDARNRSVFDEVVDALGTKYFKSDRTIRHTVAEVVRGMSYKGNLIILGMGGASILHHHPNVLNIKLIGPLDWRIANICRWKALSPEKAKTLVSDMDTAREKVLHSFLPPKVKEPHFDMIIDCLNISTQEIVEIINSLMELRKPR